MDFQRPLGSRWRWWDDYDDSNISLIPVFVWRELRSKHLSTSGLDFSRCEEESPRTRERASTWTSLWIQHPPTLMGVACGLETSVLGSKRQKRSGADRLSVKPKDSECQFAAKGSFSKYKVLWNDTHGLLLLSLGTCLCMPMHAHV